MTTADEDCKECDLLEDRLSAYERDIALVQKRLVGEFANLKQSELVALHEQIRENRELLDAAKLALHRHRFAAHDQSYDHG